MRTLWMILYSSLLLCNCKRDKPVIPQTYDGDYPYSQETGKPISTHRPIFISTWLAPPAYPELKAVPVAGQYSLSFKNHEWDHWPYIAVSMRLTTNPSAPFDRISERIFGIRFTAMLGYNCAMESVGFIIPARTGIFRFGQNLASISNNPSFTNTDCDAPKDRIEANNSATNWVEITRVDTLTKQVEGKFNLSFVNTRKDTAYAIIYPTNIFMAGSFSGPYSILR